MKSLLYCKDRQPCFLNMDTLLVRGSEPVISLVAVSGVFAIWFC